jgi:two-component system LytT family response regulator
MSSPLRAYLVDDELPALKRLNRMLGATGRVEVMGSNTNPEAAVQFLSEHEPDILFLDIQMPGMNGFELLSRLDRQPFVIFTTAYDQYALKAFEVNSVDYLLKPVEPEQLDRALNKLARLRRDSKPAWLAHPDVRDFLQELSRTIRDPHQAFPERIPVQLGERTQFLSVDRITHFFARDGLSFAATDGKSYCINWTIAELEQRLDPAKFLRIHRATLLNLDWLDELTPWFARSLAVRLKDDKRTELTVARDRVRALKERLNL